MGRKCVGYIPTYSTFSAMYNSSMVLLFITLTHYLLFECKQCSTSFILQEIMKLH